MQNPYDSNGGGRAAPFDQTFYLTIALGVGGTSGFFPDGMGGMRFSFLVSFLFFFPPSPPL